jgi:hypothetical protein
MKILMVLCLIFLSCSLKSNNRDSVKVYLLIHSRKSHQLIIHNNFEDRSGQFIYKIINTKPGICQKEFYIPIDSLDLNKGYIDVEIFKYRGMFLPWKKLIPEIILPDSTLPSHNLIIYFPRGLSAKYIWSNNLKILQELYFVPEYHY